jgi:HlyD family secretion protein
MLNSIQSLKNYLTLPSKPSMIFMGVALVLLLVLAYGFRPAPIVVDATPAKRAYLNISVEEEGRTRLPDRYEISTPVTGYITRISLNPGDEVKRGMVLFTINPIQASPLDARNRAQAEALLARAESALEAMRSQIDSEEARVKLAEIELARIQHLADAGHLSAENLDRAQAEAKRATASLRSTRFSVDVARHERDSARATLAAKNKGSVSAPITVHSPVDGVVLKRMRQSEGPVQYGEPVIIVGDLASLNIEVDVLSPDAVRLQPGMRVELARWGGDHLLMGKVQRIEPAGFTRFSALGVEEQRVWVIVDVETERSQWSTLGDGYRVEARFIVWEQDNVLQVPTSALFREGDAWYLYVVHSHRARRRTVTVGRQSGLSSEILSGVKESDSVILYPGQEVHEGSRISVRQ